MKKLIYFIVFICFLGFNNLKAQSTNLSTVVAMLQHNNQSTDFYGINAFVSAYTAAVDNDTIYLSAGTFNSPYTISKTVKIYGTGCYTDATTQATTINDTIVFEYGSGSSSIEGVIIPKIYISNDSYGSLLHNVNILRCKVDTIMLFSMIGGSIDSTLIENCIINNGIYIGGSQQGGQLILNNIFLDNSRFCIIGVNYSLIKNNTFLYNSTGHIVNISQEGINFILNSVSNCTFENNVFYDIGDFINWNLYTMNNGSDGNTFDRNIFLVPSFNPYNVSNTTMHIIESNHTYTFLTNYTTTDATSIFTSFDGSITTFNFSNNYHLKNPSLYPTADGTTELGMYGGGTPFRDNAIPANPHITSTTVSDQTDQNGALPVNISTQAQSY